MAQVPWELPLYLLPQTQHGTGEKPNFLHFSLTRTSPFFSWWEELFVAVVRGGKKKDGKGEREQRYRTKFSARIFTLG